MGPQPASLVSRTAIKPLGRPATSTQLPLIWLHELFRQVTPSWMFRSDRTCSPIAIGLATLEYWSPLTELPQRRRPGNANVVALRGHQWTRISVAGASRSSASLPG